jgi:hypothetical protein
MEVTCAMVSFRKRNHAIISRASHRKTVSSRLGVHGVRVRRAAAADSVIAKELLKRLKKMVGSHAKAL